MGNSASATTHGDRYGKWVNVNTSGNFPGLYGGACCSIGKMLYLFGGSDGTLDTARLYTFNTETFQWKTPLVHGELPSARSFHSLSAVNNRKIYLFGGFSKATRTSLNDMWLLDTKLERLEWKRVTWEGEGPAERYEHTANVMGQFIYVFGGGNARGWLNDVKLFNTVLCKWYSITPLGSKPQKRLSHSAAILHDKLVIIGGYDPSKQRLNDIHVLQTMNPTESNRTFGWMQPKLSGRIPSERAAFSALPMDTSILIFGGYNNANLRLNDVYLFDYASLECQEVKTFSTEKPACRSYHFAAMVGRRMFIIGGFDGHEKLDDVWYFDLDLVERKAYVELPPSTLSKTLKELVNQSKYSDITFTFDKGERVYAHKVILSNRSQHFRAMLEGGMLESSSDEIHLKEVDREIFLLLLEEIYTEDLQLTPSNIVEVYKMAHVFGESALQTKCERFLEEGIDMDNVCAIFHLAHTFYAEHLRKAALNFIIIQYEFLNYREEFKLLPEYLLSEVKEIVRYNSSFRKK